MLVDLFSVNAPLDELTILKLPTSYHTTIACNLLGLLKSRLVQYAPISTVTKYICRIIVSTPFRHTIFNFMHAHLLLDTWGNEKPCIGIIFDFFFDLSYVPMFLNGTRSAPTVYSRIVGDEGGTN